MISIEKPSVKMVKLTRYFMISSFCMLLYHHFGDVSLYKQSCGTMANKSIRKNDSLGSTVVRLRHDMKTEHGKYNDYVSDLAILTKSELNPLIRAMTKKPDNNGVNKNITEIFGKIENVLYDMSDTQTAMDEIVQVIGGLEFSTNNTVDKLAEILRDQEIQQSRMAKEINQIREEFAEAYQHGEPTGRVQELVESLKDFQIAFSIFQDHIIASVPRITKVFEELDREADFGERYGRTKQI
jgi:hypothetical protein